MMTDPRIAVITTDHEARVMPIPAACCSRVRATPPFEAVLAGGRAADEGHDGA